MKFTENFNLNLPDLDDMADVEKMNENFQTIDTKMKSLETDPELAANVVDIKNKIGTEEDADTQPTLFGRLAQLKNVLVEKLAEVLTKITGIDGKIGTSGDSKETQTLFGKLQKILYSTEKDNIELVPSDNVKATLYASPITLNNPAILVKRKAEHSGVIKIKFNLVSQGASTTLALGYGSLKELRATQFKQSDDDDTIQILNWASALLNGNEGDLFTSARGGFNTSTNGKDFIFPFASTMQIRPNVNATERTILFPVSKNEYYFILIDSYQGANVNNLRICYDEQEVS